jgi:low temperature requirement protein LtrA
MRRLVLFASLPARDSSEGHRAATQLELLFDLISVIALAAVTAGLHHAISEGHGLEKLPVFVFLFTAIWWAWMNFTWFASAFDNDGPGYRVLVMIIMAGELLFAGGAGHLFETLDLGWGIVGWTIMRVAMAALWLRASASPGYKSTALRYAIGILIAQAGWVAFYFVAEPNSAQFYVLGALCFLIEFAVPPIAENARATPFHRHHIIERYGLLAIIALGEIMLSISMAFGTLYTDHPSWPAVGTAASALVTVFAIFWIYFCERDHLPSSDLKTALVWGYGHVLIFAAIAVLGAAVAAEIDLSTDHSHTSLSVVAWWLGAPLALFYGAIWLTRDRLLAGSRQIALPVVGLAVLAASAAGAPSWVFAVLSVVAVIWRVPMGAPASAAHGEPTVAARPTPHE